MAHFIFRPATRTADSQEIRKPGATETFGEVPSLDIVITAVKLLVPRVAVMITQPVAVLPVVKLKLMLL